MKIKRVIKYVKNGISEYNRTAERYKRDGVISTSVAYCPNAIVFNQFEESKDKSIGTIMRDPDHATALMFYQEIGHGYEKVISVGLKNNKDDEFIHISDQLRIFFPELNFRATVDGTFAINGVLEVLEVKTSKDTSHTSPKAKHFKQTLLYAYLFQTNATVLYQSRKVAEWKFKAGKLIPKLDTREFFIDMSNEDNIKLAKKELFNLSLGYVMSKFNNKRSTMYMLPLDADEYNKGSEVCTFCDYRSLCYGSYEDKIFEIIGESTTKQMVAIAEKYYNRAIEIIEGGRYHKILKRKYEEIKNESV